MGPAGLPEPSDDDHHPAGHDHDDDDDHDHDFDDIDDVGDIDHDDDVQIYEERDCGSQGGKGPGIPR